MQSEDTICFEKALEEIVLQNISKLDEKKQQTDYKIKYMKEYVTKWLYVTTERPDVKNINFIDCMCNAGVYQDKNFCTSIEVLKIFNQFARKYRQKQFYLILNDLDGKRIEITTSIVNLFSLEPNITVKYYTQDVNDFLSNTHEAKLYMDCYPSKAQTILFVDPYDFCTVPISAMKNFSERYYCELIYNAFTSDYARNWNSERMLSYLQKEQIQATDLEGLKKEIIENLKGKHIKYAFSYKFKIATNVTLYEIMYFTPHIKGLEKLKEALWKVFDGKEYHRNHKEDQLSLFSLEDDKDMSMNTYKKEASALLISKFNGKTVSYTEIEEFMLENTMLSTTDIIKHVLKNLLEDKKIIKCGYVASKINYKQDSYMVL